ncbi:Orotate phosphoribosyltransferase,orotate phosphoribosyltransferase,orotate phosphoribosyltransferase,Phosphoribosyl transferase domain [Chlamydia poikilotherma]|uniref:Orotate phosphoribosyltransferase n=1 Tax=Chlamydia poikilotherma TaxID=1967783 RepID=A0A3B0PN97_9CHLA|nr:orotate phosphoribosyltransferase [Chlamydia poikilotherma]SYX08623.1 Orotate phosphoribosyltransferase,orotate phosphoribosyltransferase,orotate phosphoribosyltransferase,Phosphoribosyl transferase domain [Chlamydia poikilotherma]
MMSFEEEQLRDHVIVNLYRIGAIRFGDFNLSDGQKTPIYVDMRLVISCPDVLQTIASLIWRLRPSFNSSLLCGVPYTALALATCISLKYNISMVLRRKELKHPNQEDKIKVEGIFSPGQTCLVINDVIASGRSILDTAKALEDEGLNVRESLVFLDRQVGGTDVLKEAGIKLRSVFTLEELVRSLLSKCQLKDKDATIATTLVETF